VSSSLELWLSSSPSAQLKPSIVSTCMSSCGTSSLVPLSCGDALQRCDHTVVEAAVAPQLDRCVRH
jgi:hypothetical protein